MAGVERDLGAVLARRPMDGQAAPVGAGGSASTQSAGVAMRGVNVFFKSAMFETG